MIFIFGSWNAAILRRPRRSLGAFVLAAGGADLVIYADDVARAAGSAVLPVVQKVATLALVLWVLTTALALRWRAAGL